MPYATSVVSTRASLASLSCGHACLCPPSPQCRRWHSGEQYWTDMQRPHALSLAATEGSGGLPHMQQVRGREEPGRLLLLPPPGPGADKLAASTALLPQLLPPGADTLAPSTSLLLLLPPEADTLAPLAANEPSPLPPPS